MTLLSDFRRKLDRFVLERDHALRAVDDERAALVEAREATASAVEGQRIVQSVAEELQTSANQRIAAVVTRCLSSVFGQDAPTFRILFPKRRGKTEAQLEFVQGENSLTEPLEESDGGSVDVAALGLRLACLMLATPRRRRLLVLDEPFRNIHGSGNRERAADLLLTLSKEMGLQVIMATGLEWLRVGNVIDLDEGDVR